MKIIGVIGTNKQGQEAVRKGLAKAMGWDGYSVVEETKEYIETIGTASDVETLMKSLAKKTAVIETRLLSKIFENAVDGRWGLVVTDILEEKTIELIASLGGEIVSVGNDSEVELTEVNYTSNAEHQILDEQELALFIKEEIPGMNQILEGFNRKTVKEAIKIQHDLIVALTKDGFEVLSQAK